MKLTIYSLALLSVASYAVAATLSLYEKYNKATSELEGEIMTIDTDQKVSKWVDLPKVAVGYTLEGEIGTKYTVKIGIVQPVPGTAEYIQLTETEDEGWNLFRTGGSKVQVNNYKIKKSLI
ncbi:Uu.00g116390.m01.CDS01 [Anthostomella pinea]|uniref:Uu.00g116390.m01.CDS01 n=1 Tax=Anthostomella pinea TaxID=933095 RepID=A0AAI8YGR1_9PEZI|nr:Uu.00g116390.m01.CDS01 [Anthostomella pinea]